MSETASLIDAARLSTDPKLVSSMDVNFGGIDPLGLREINFDLMNDLFKGLNNVANHVRPYVLTIWSWSRALEIAGQSEANILAGAELTQTLAAMDEFVDRIEVIYLWSQILRDPYVSLPGRWSLGGILSADFYDFDGPNWAALRQQRRYSTSFRAAVNYGPGLRNLGWGRSPPQFSEILIPTEHARLAIDAFQGCFVDHLKHPAFSVFGPVRVTKEDVETWADLWALDTITEAEASTAANLIAGDSAAPARRKAFALLTEAARKLKTEGPSEVRQLRHRMAEIELSEIPELDQTRDLWRRLQTRQLFRLALESLYGWITRRLGSIPRSTDHLVQKFLAAASDTTADTTREWLKGTEDESINPVDMLNVMVRANEEAEGAPSIEAAIRRAFAFCLVNDLDDKSTTRPDRLPIARAKRETDPFLDQDPEHFMRHVIEAWVLAQHTYWSVGRGLADARAGGKQILRLRVVMEEGGWALSDGRAEIERAFQPTGDRLETALSLAKECRLLD